MCRSSTGEVDHRASEEPEQRCSWVAETKGDEAGERLRASSFRLGATRRHQMCVMWQRRERGVEFVCVCV